MMDSGHMLRRSLPPHITPTFRFKPLPPNSSPDFQLCSAQVDYDSYVQENLCDGWMDGDGVWEFLIGEVQPELTYQKMTLLNLC